MDSLWHRSRKTTLAALTVALATLGVAGSAFATGSSEPAARGCGTATPTGSSEPAARGCVPPATVYMRLTGPHTLSFVGPDKVRAGDDLRIINQTSPRQVGPHTFSLVTRGVLPKTRPARRGCFAPNHICREIAKWHGTNGNSPITKNPAKAGQSGWDTMGNLNRDGDSWFAGNQRSIVQQVSADVSDGPQRLYYLCAIHSFMQGSINVVP